MLVYWTISEGDIAENKQLNKRKTILQKRLQTKVVLIDFQNVLFAYKKKYVKKSFYWKL